jgi:hypothetical protein
MEEHPANSIAAITQVFDLRLPQHPVPVPWHPTLHQQSSTGQEPRRILSRSQADAELEGFI